MWLYFHCGTSKKFSVFVFLVGRGRADANQQKHTKKLQSLNLIRSHASIMTTVTVIIISLITNIKIAIIIIEITKTIIIITIFHRIPWFIVSKAFCKSMKTFSKISLYFGLKPV